jgi:hypothetical protein
MVVEENLAKGKNMELESSRPDMAVWISYLFIYLLYLLI